MDFVENYQGFEIHFTAEPEYEAVDLDDTKTNKRIERQIQNGKMEYFTARVDAVSHGVVLGTNYLGQCIHKRSEDFYTKYHDDYFSDMRAAAIEEALIKVESLYNTLIDEE